MDEVGDVWSHLMSLPLYRRTLVGHRLAAATFLVVLLSMVIGGTLGMPGQAFMVLLDMAVVLGFGGGLIAWTVLLLVLRDIRRHSAVTVRFWDGFALFQMLGRLYVEELVCLGRRRNVFRS